MKKEIMNLITSSEGQFRINNISYLKRWTKDGMGEDTVGIVDMELNNGLGKAMYKLYKGLNGSSSYEIYNKNKRI